MFTGIIESLGRIVSVEERDGDRRLLIEAGALLAGARLGDSLAVNGICLTVAHKTGTQFAADLSRAKRWA